MTLAHITQAQTAQLAQQAQANAEKAARDAASAAAPRHESGQVFDASQLAAAYAAGPARPTAQPKHAPVAAGAAGAVLATEAIHGKSEITETLFPIKVDGTPFTLIPLQNKDGLYLSYAILIENKINAEHIAAFRTALELGQLDSDHIKKLTGMNNGFELRLHGQLGDHRVLGKQHEGEEVICQALQSALPADQQDSIDYLLKALPILEGASHKRLIVFYYQTNHTGIDNWVQKNR